MRRCTPGIVCAVVLLVPVVNADELDEIALRVIDSKIDVPGVDQQCRGTFVVKNAGPAFQIRPHVVGPSYGVLIYNEQGKLLFRNIGGWGPSMNAEGTVSLRWDTHSNHLGETSEPPFLVPAAGRYRLEIALTMGSKRDRILDVSSKWFAVSAETTGANTDNGMGDDTADLFKRPYQDFVEALDKKRIATDYPKALQKLDSSDPQVQIAGVKTLAATGEVEVIPWIVPFLDSEDNRVRIYAGQALNALVAGHELRRRDLNQPGNVVIKPLGPGELDLKPMAWVILEMLRKPDDGNTHAFAANMIGYLKLGDFEDELRQLLKSRHPAVTRAARNALEMLGVDHPGVVSETELGAARAARASVDVTRQADSRRFTRAYDLIQQGNYEEALHLLEQNIAETPNAGNIDYSYAWGCVCAAHLGRFDKTLDYYRVMRTRFYGWLHLGAGGANRKWDSQLEMIRQAVASREHPEKDAVLEKMAALDELARRLMLADMEQLSRRAAGGDQVAILQLRQRPYGLVDLIVEGRLVPVDVPGKDAMPPKKSPE